MVDFDRLNLVANSAKLIPVSCLAMIACLWRGVRLGFFLVSELISCVWIERLEGTL
jgi:hypothetical protein